jgi:predicted nucleotide-binding protein
MPIQNFAAEDVGAYFEAAHTQLGVLRDRLPGLYADFPEIDPTPNVQMMEPHPPRFGRPQVEKLGRTIDQLFEIRANSQLATPEAEREPRVFLSHGRAGDWREVQSFIERDIGIATLELEQEPNLGRTILEKLRQESARCTSAVIVMTGDDIDVAGMPRARENVLHEIGYFQGRFGLSAVCLLYEEGTAIPSNIHGLVYIPFPKGTVRATFGALTRELKSFYRRG